MRRVLGILIVVTATSVRPAAASLQQAERTAYDRWRGAVEANPVLGTPFWLSSDSGPPELRTAVQELVSFGPNLLPFLVEELRTETNRLRLYRLILLVNRVSGINLYYDSGYENYYAAAPDLAAHFLSAWDSGQYANASVVLGRVWKDPDTAQRIDPKSITPVRRYGVFAIPFIAESLRQQESSELFAAFLIITGETDLYTKYINDPSGSMATRGEQLAFITAWARKHVDKVDRLHGLHERIRSLAGR